MSTLTINPRTVNTIDDLLLIINNRPEWRRRMRQALFPELDVPKAFADLARAQERTDRVLADLVRAQEHTDKALADLARAQYQTEVAIKEMAKELRELQIIVKDHSTRLARIEDKVDSLDSKVDSLDSKVDSLDSKVDLLDSKVDSLEGKVDSLESGQNDLKGRTYEQQFINRAAAIFGRFLQRGKDKRNEIGDQLEVAEDNGGISEAEHDQVLASDLLWGGKLKSTKARPEERRKDLFLAVEVSYTAELTDIERASKRAAILRSIGLPTLPVVAGINWPSEIVNEAHRCGVVVVRDMALDKMSWRDAYLKI